MCTVLGSKNSTNRFHLAHRARWTSEVGMTGEQTVAQTEVPAYPGGWFLSPLYPFISALDRSGKIENPPKKSKKIENRNHKINSFEKPIFRSYRLV